MSSTTTKKSKLKDRSVENRNFIDGSSSTTSQVKTREDNTTSNIGSVEILDYNPLSERSRIISCYALLGGGVGGLVLWLVFSIIAVFPMFEVLPFAFIGGAAVGFIPSLITAMILLKRKTILNHPSKWIELFIIGAVVCALYSVIIIIVSSYLNAIPLLAGFPDIIFIILAMAGIGGISSFIIGGFVFPRQSNCVKE